MTRVGKVIRKIRVDEIPQFWNILRGDMNFVGPRPERPHLCHSWRRRSTITNNGTDRARSDRLAQIKYPYGASIEDAKKKLEYDLYYIKNQNVMLDATIMFETIKTICPAEERNVV